jgi:hypothetical protein
MTRPVSMDIETLRVGEAELHLACALTSPAVRAASGGCWIWVISEENGVRRARLYQPRQSGVGRDGHIAFAIRPSPRPAAGAIVGLAVAVRGARGHDVTGRSEVVAMRWPPPVLIVGSPVVISARDAAR